jgi:hypothetical protein
MPSWRGSATRSHSPNSKASEEVIAKSLVGDYRAEHLFTLDQSVIAYRRYQKLIAGCDKEIRRCLDHFKPATQPVSELGGSDQKGKPKSEDGVLRNEFKRVFRVDLKRIPGIRTGIAQTLFGEIGTDFTKFRSASGRSDRISPNSAVHQRSPRGWDCVRTTTSAAARFCGFYLSAHAGQTRTPESDHCCGTQTGPHRLPPDHYTARVRRLPIRRRSTPLRKTIGTQTTGQGARARIPTHPRAVSRDGSLREVVVPKGRAVAPSPSSRTTNPEDSITEIEHPMRKSRLVHRSG